MPLDDLRELVLRFGPALIVLGAAFEGDATAVLAGVAAHLGLIPPATAIVAAAAGAVVGDCVWFTVGRMAGPRIRRARLYARVGPAVERLAARLGPAEVILAHFVYGTRLASMVFWGMRRIPVARFVALDVIGCAAWACALVGVGYLSSRSASVVLHELGQLERGLLAASVVALLATALLRAVVRRRLQRAAAAAPEPRSHEPGEG